MKLSLSNIRHLIGVALVIGTVLVPLVVLQGSAGEPAEVASAGALRYAPGSEEFGTLEDYLTARVTYPTGVFDQRWLLNAAKQDKLVKSAVPAGPKSYRPRAEAAVALDPNAFTSLGPRPENNGFGNVGGRVNSIAVDPVDPTIAYFAAVGGGVWKSTNCCTASTTWVPTTDKPHINSIAIDDLFIDQNRWVYAGVGDLNFGSFSMGSAGILRSKDQGATWEVLGEDVFIPRYPPALTPTFPQYQAVGKVRVDPNNSNTIIAGTKTGLYFSYDSGANWSGPCLTNLYTTQRQDITGLAVTDNGTTTRLIAAVGTRGYPTTVQPDLGKNGANGIYSITLPATLLPDGCPAAAGWTLLTTGANGWPAGTGSGNPCDPAVGSTNQCPAGTNEVGRIDIAIAPSDPNVIYAEVQAVDPPGDTSPLSGCASARGCLLGLWQTLNGGATWTKNADGDNLVDCAEGNSAQNWYNQGVAVDPVNHLHIYMDGIDIWQSFNGGLTLTNVTCGYTVGLTHVDQHALTFVPGATPPGSKLLAGNDGGVYLTDNAFAPQPVWTQLNDSVATIEFYSGDISGNFANAATPVAVGGAQDNGSSSAANPGPTSVWTERNGGDGMFARIEQKSGQRVYMESQWGALVRSTTGHAGSYSGASGGWGPGNAASGDRESFVTPYEIDRHHCPGAICSNMILGTYRVWESTSSTGAQNWHINSPDLTKCGANPCLTGLRDRAIINALFYGHSDNSVAVVGTNDGNVQYGFNLGQGVANSATWVNVTGSNAVLPNRPILDVTTSANNPLVSFVSVGGFAENTPAQPGHVYQVTCTAMCASFTWVDKTGNLPNIPADSIAVNPNRPTQVFAGTDWGLYFTNDISVASPVWSRFDAGLPHVMIWDMAIDRGATTLAVFTRGRGAYAWPLPKTPTAVQVRSFTARARAAGVTLSWRSASEVDTLGYNIWRFVNGKGVKVNRRLVEAKGQAGGATYRLVDRNARPGAYSYRLQAVSRDGSRAWRAKANVRVGRH